MKLAIYKTSRQDKQVKKNKTTPVELQIILLKKSLLIKRSLKN